MSAEDFSAYREIFANNGFKFQIQVEKFPGKPTDYYVNDISYYVLTWEENTIYNYVHRNDINICDHLDIEKECSCITHNCECSFKK